MLVHQALVVPAHERQLELRGLVARPVLRDLVDRLERVPRALLEPGVREHAALPGLLERRLRLLGAEAAHRRVERVLVRLRHVVPERDHVLELLGVRDVAQEARAEIDELQVHAGQRVEGLDEQAGLRAPARVGLRHRRERFLRHQVAGGLAPQLLVDREVEAEERHRALGVTHETLVHPAQLVRACAAHELVDQQVEKEVGERLLQSRDEPLLEELQRRSEREAVREADVVPDLVGQHGREARERPQLHEQRQVHDHLARREVDVGERLVAVPVRGALAVEGLGRAQAHGHVPHGERVFPGPRDERRVCRFGVGLAHAG